MMLSQLLCQQVKDWIILLCKQNSRLVFTNFLKKSYTIYYYKQNLFVPLNIMFYMDPYRLQPINSSFICYPNVFLIPQIYTVGPMGINDARIGKNWQNYSMYMLFSSSYGQLVYFVRHSNIKSSNVERYWTCIHFL